MTQANFYGPDTILRAECLATRGWLAPTRDAVTATALNLGQAEECEDFGWAEAQPGGGYHLTDLGWRILSEYCEGKN